MNSIQQYKERSDFEDSDLPPSSKRLIKINLSVAALNDNRRIPVSSTKKKGKKKKRLRQPRLVDDAKQYTNSDDQDSAGYIKVDRIDPVAYMELQSNRNAAILK